MAFELLHRGLLHNFIVLAQFQLFLERLTFRSQLILHLLSFRRHSSLLLFKLVLQVGDRLRLEQDDLRLLREFKSELLDLLVDIVDFIVSAGLGCSAHQVFDFLVLVDGLGGEGWRRLALDHPTRARRG